MGQVLVRNLDDEVIERLKTKAELKGHSLEQELQQELREALTAAAPLTSEEKLAVAHRLRSMSPALPDFDVSTAIRFGRDDQRNE